uniref:SGF29 C-terminal domain-containing protein n=1 Tax=Rhizochromulina marina TaxID=1034831 RepID=A0A7S2RUZ2_9STRA|mmetsp:Transcript_21422/g.62403  ORF Transcript_21422/g.62403 Transcript_21422/m.62403 type:complete len:406 (+) Transcript_21422:259-1476(+)|eukprot:CAMPEP_0118962130 /NCGR_PEP_ID=MMETSP1173-20130426/571_1 /TAXON_ID=1034831 /ORGANISM="Rhizochromulina marina cf, Strain CCMP1243" /LENGTH=405 /DNA_ID=CAMNT_0006910349 /DNA_START=259 /DNA_END=1476 /DNA_ORIENTATION=+
MSYSQLVKTAGKRKMNAKPPVRQRASPRGAALEASNAATSSKSSVSPFRDRTAGLLRRKSSRNSKDDSADRSASAPVKRPSFLARKNSNSSIVAEEAKKSSVSKQRPGSFLIRKRSQSKLKDDADDVGPTAAAKDSPKASTSMRRPSINRKNSSGRLSPVKPVAESRPRSAPRAVSAFPGNGGATPSTPEEKAATEKLITPSKMMSNPDPSTTEVTPDQAILALRNKLHDTERLITACQGKITEYQTKLAMFRAEKLEVEMKISKQEQKLKRAKFPPDTKVQVNLSFDALHPVWAEAIVVEHDLSSGTFVLIVENFGEVDSVPAEKVRHVVLAPDHEKVYEFDEDTLAIGMAVEVNTGVDDVGNQIWTRGVIQSITSETGTFEVLLDNEGILEDVPRGGLRPFPE